MNSRICQPKRSRINLSISSAFTMIASSIALTVISPSAFADNDGNCSQLPGHSALKAALQVAVGSPSGIPSSPNGGFGLQMWGTILNRDGVVCAVAFTGTDRGSEWPGSRVISAQKANTANSFSLPGLALSSANLWAAVQPGGSLYGLQHSNPVSTDAAYKGPSSNFGQFNDPMVGSKIGGVNVFGGGLALYNSHHVLVGAVGVSGDTSCADHNIAWRTRHNLNLDFVTGGVGADSTRPDNINYQGLVSVPSLQNDFSHPICKIGGVDGVSGLSAALPPKQ
jgi:Haem-degrading